MGPSQPAVKYLGAAAIFSVADVAASLAYYRDIFGFGVQFEWATPVSYACLCRDEVALHLAASKLAKRPAGQGALSIFVDNVDALYAELVGRGARIIVPPADRAYGMRDFSVLDPDGNVLVFGMSIAGRSGG